MIAPKILHLLNRQIRLEGESAQIYLSMHTWANDYGLEGTAEWFLVQYHEEVNHMLKFIKYINTQGCRAVVSQLDTPPQDFKDIKYVFEETLKHELFIEKNLKDLLKAARDEGDITTEVFLHWYITEQIEEEDNVRRILDKIKHGGTSGAGLLEVDSFIAEMRES